MTIYDSLDRMRQIYSCPLISSIRSEKWGRRHQEAKFRNPLETPNPETQKVALAGYQLTLLSPNLSHPQTGEEAHLTGLWSISLLPWLSEPTRMAAYWQNQQDCIQNVYQFFQRTFLQTSKADFIQRRKVQNRYQLNV